MTTIITMSKRTRKAIPQDAPNLELSFIHCTLVQYIFGSMSVLSCIRLYIRIQAPTTHNSGHRNPNQNNYSQS